MLVENRTHALRRALQVALVALLALAMVGPAFAEKKEKPGKPETKKVKPMSEMVLKRVAKVNEAMEAEDWPAALGALEDLKKRERKLDDHEKALMYQLYGYVYSSQEDYESAVGAFEQCLQYQRIDNPVLALDTQFNLSQLYLATGKFQKAVDNLLDWFEKTDGAEPRAYYMVAISYLQLQQPDKALPWAKNAIAKMDERGENPPESWLQLQAALHFMLDDYASLEPLLKRLIQHYPKRDYWLQLANVHGELKNEKEMLAVLELAYTQGFLEKDTELIRLAHLYLYHEVPYRAAQVIEQGRKDGIIEMDEESWRLLANSYMHAREFDAALAPLSQAADLSDDGNLYVQLAQVRLERQEWQEARNALDAAMKKGELDNPGDVHVLMGVANMSDDRPKAARAAFIKAKKYDDSRKVASQWIAHLDREAKARE